MKHLLFVYPHDRTNTHELAEEICDVLLGFSRSNNINYTYGPKYIVIHFSTDPNSLQELEDVLTVYIEKTDIDFTYFITQVNDGFRTNISSDIYDYLVNFKEDKTPSKEYDLLINNYFFGELKEFENLINEMESELTVDEILDKISEQGMDSLTKQELNKLKNY